MGRHSVAEDEDDDEDLLDLLGSDRPTEPTVSAPVAAMPSRGRHAQAEADDEPDTFAVSERNSGPRRGGGTRADLRLMRHNRALLARCLAAVIVPFLLYSLVLEMLGKRTDYLLLIWVPAIVAGVLLGSFLDTAHRRSAAETRA